MTVPEIGSVHPDRFISAATVLAAFLRLSPWPVPPLRPPPPCSADSRLQPRDTRITAAFLLLFACVVAAAVFVAVPRAVNVGEISVKTDRMSWNTTKVWRGTRGGVGCKHPGLSSEGCQLSCSRRRTCLLQQATAARPSAHPSSAHPHLYRRSRRTS